MNATYKEMRADTISTQVMIARSHDFIIRKVSELHCLFKNNILSP